MLDRLNAVFAQKVDFSKLKNRLTDHMVFHYEAKFSCSFCDHKSYTEGDLTKHEKTHVKNKYRFLFNKMLLLILN